MLGSQKILRGKCKEKNKKKKRLWEVSVLGSHMENHLPIKKKRCLFLNGIKLILESLCLRWMVDWDLWAFLRRNHEKTKDVTLLSVVFSHIGFNYLVCRITGITS